MLCAMLLPMLHPNLTTELRLIYEQIRELAVRASLPLPKRDVTWCISMSNPCPWEISIGEKGLEQCAKDATEQHAPLQALSL